MPEPQSFRNHARIIPLYHIVVFGILAVNLGWSVWRAIVTPWMDTVMGVLMAIAMVLLAFYARAFALTVQDRVIRLEMQMRLRALLAEDWHPRIDEFTHHQLVALRFASDAELPVLAMKVLTEKLQDRRAIKQLVQQWKADHLRA